jgi:hypothetical protein
MMKKALLLLAISAVLFTTSCVSNFTASADYDKKTDFTQYKTYSVLPWNPQVSTSIQESPKTKLYQALRNEMDKRGYTHVEKGGDLAVGLSVLVEEKVEYRSDGTVNYNVGYGYYGYGGYGMGYSTPTTIREYDYNEGTIIIDIFDEKQKQMVWQGYGQDRLDDVPHKNESKIDTYLKNIFYKYPVKPKRK